MIGITIKHGYITGTNKVYEDYLFRKDKNNIFNRTIRNSENNMDKYMNLYINTGNEKYLRLYNISRDQYVNTLEYYNTNYPKRDDVIIYIQNNIPMSRSNRREYSYKNIIYPSDWE